MSSMPHVKYICVCLARPVCYMLGETRRPGKLTGLFGLIRDMGDLMDRPPVAAQTE